LSASKPSLVLLSFGMRGPKGAGWPMGQFPPYKDIFIP
jgi:hypothetical protein